MNKLEWLTIIFTVFFFLGTFVSPAGAVRLQVGAFDRSGNLRRRVKLLKSLGVKVKREESPEGYTRVRTADLEPEEARALKKRLEKRRINSFFVDYIPPPAPEGKSPAAATDSGPQLPLTAREVKQRVEKVEGTPYRWGQESPTRGFDCSGLIKWLLPHPRLPRTVLGMRNWSKKIMRDKLQTGDLIFFRYKSDTRPDHVGIYLGADRFAHASKHNGVVTADLSREYYQARLTGFGRFPVELVERKYSRRN